MLCGVEVANSWVAGAGADEVPGAGHSGRLAFLLVVFTIWCTWLFLHFLSIWASVLGFGVQLAGWICSMI